VKRRAAILPATVDVGDAGHRDELPQQRVPQQLPAVGVGKVFSRAEYNPWIAGAFLVAIFLALYAFVRSDLGFRLMQLGGRKKKGTSHPEPMV
jgi:hypothetical protein